jgi:hypothetical protein
VAAERAIGQQNLLHELRGRGLQHFKYFNLLFSASELIIRVFKVHTTSCEKAIAQLSQLDVAEIGHD